jgi:hypothetical protein
MPRYSSIFHPKGLCNTFSIYIRSPNKDFLGIPQKNLFFELRLNPGVGHKPMRSLSFYCHNLHQTASLVLIALGGWLYEPIISMI